MAMIKKKKKKWISPCSLLWAIGLEYSACFLPMAGKFPINICLLLLSLAITTIGRCLALKVEMSNWETN